MFEIELYRLCRVFNMDLYGRKLGIECVDNYHHIFQLKKYESELTSEQLENLNLNIEKILQINPTGFMEYQLFSDCLSLLSSLMVKWNLISANNYAYRLTGPGVNIRILDLNNLNENVMTAELVWLSVMVHEEPLVRYMDISVK